MRFYINQKGKEQDVAVNFKDMTGQRFGKLKVIKRVDNNKYNRAQWECKCDCGNTVEVEGGVLRSGNSKSCGCMQGMFKHGQSQTKLYRVYYGIKDRCCNPNEPSYENYGGRGIEICDEWINDFTNFRDWAHKSGYRNGLTIDRINNDGNYEPSNCRWITMKEQQNNKRTNRIILFNGNKYTISELADKLGLSYNVVYGKINRNSLAEWK